jgi:cysteine synthase A
MTKIYDDITKVIGNTPLVRINKLTQEFKAEVVVHYRRYPDH